MNRGKRVLIENFLSLSILQGLNYLIPLITFPYLVNVLGIEKFGLVTFSQSVMQYLVIFTDYGFNLTATREISRYRKNKDRVSRIFCNTMAAKICLMLLCLFVFTFIMFFFDRFRLEYLFYIVSFGIVVGNVLFPLWFFQGIEKMKWITILVFVAKVVSASLIFLLVKNPYDYRLVPVFNSIGLMIAGIISLVLISRKYIEISFKWVTIAGVLKELKRGFYVFLTSISGNLYGQGATVILGLLTSDVMVGYYSVAEKLFKALCSIGSIISQTLFPMLSNKLRKGGWKELLVKIIKMIVLFSLILSVTAFVFSEIIYTRVARTFFLDGVIALRVLVLLVPIDFVNNITNAFLVALRYDKTMSKVYVVAGLIFLFVCPVAILLFGIYGPVAGLYFVEFYVLIASLINLFKVIKKSDAKVFNL